MATMPGLPMFGHGQLEGFAERYGMEFRRARLDEAPDADLLARHEREIYPLLHKRELFAESAHFALYDFWTADGGLNEDVFVYSNRRDDERTLVACKDIFGDPRSIELRNLTTVARLIVVPHEPSADHLAAVERVARRLALPQPVRLSDYKGKTVVLAFFFRARTRG